MLLLSALLATAAAATLPGLPLTFEVDDQGRWVLPQALPPDFVAAGVEPGWVLSAVDGHPSTRPAPSGGWSHAGRPAGAAPLRHRRRRDIQKRSPGTGRSRGAPEAPAGGRATPVSARGGGAGPARPSSTPTRACRRPEGLRRPRRGGGCRGRGSPSRSIRRAPSGPRPHHRRGPHAEPAAAGHLGAVHPKLWWSLSSDRWAIGGENQRLRVASPEEAEADFAGAVRIASFQGNRVEHLVVPEPDGVALFSVGFPRGTGTLPACQPAVPETCLVAGRHVLEAFGGLEGAQEEGRRMLGLACSEGVYRACLEVLALDRPSQAETTAACIAQDANACHARAREQLRVRPEATDPVTVGLPEHACATDASGSPGERLRRLEDVGEGCVLLSAAADRLEAPTAPCSPSTRPACWGGRPPVTRRPADGRRPRRPDRPGVRERGAAAGLFCVQLGHLPVRPIVDGARSLRCLPAGL